MNRRHFLASGLVPAALPFAAAAPLPVRKAVLIGMLPKSERSGQLARYQEQFTIARESGFEYMECRQVNDPAEAEDIRKAADSAGLKIHSVMNGDHWRFPLSSADPEVVRKSMAAMRISLHNAKLWGADAVLLVPAVVDPSTSYQQAWDRSQRMIRELIPLAEQLRVVIAVEEVWNKFLLSPLEFAHYVDEFKSPWVKAYFDVGNVVLFSYPQDWIRTLGRRIVKLHLKDFRFRPDPFTGKRQAEFVNLGQGDIDWPEIHRALSEINYTGIATVELSGGDKAYLSDVARRVDAIFAGRRPGAGA